jgi:hypothetical protein
MLDLLATQEIGLMNQLLVGYNHKNDSYLKRVILFKEQVIEKSWLSL